LITEPSAISRKQWTYPGVEAFFTVARNGKRSNPTSVATFFAISRNRCARFPWFLLFCVQIAFEQCEGNLITFALLMHAWTCFTRASSVCPAGHWLGPVTRPGWLGLAQPLWGWAQPSHQYICWAGFSPAQPPIYFFCWAGPGPAQLKKIIIKNKNKRQKNKNKKNMHVWIKIM